MNQDAIIVMSILIILIILLFVFLVKNILKLSKFKKKYSPIINIDEAVQKSRKEKNKIDDDIEKLRASYKEKKYLYDKLLKQISIYDEELELAEYGFYKPHFDFDTSEIYKDKIKACKDKQKRMIQNKNAVYCTQEWIVEGSRAKGKTMTNRNIRLTSRAFNNECDALISNVRWNNILKFEERLVKAKDSIDKMNASNKIYINQKYLTLKIEELRLTHEYRDKKQKEKEEQAEIRRQMREEEKLQKEIEDAEKEEIKFQKMFDKAQKDAEKAVGSKLDKLKEKMALLEKELKDAHEKNEKAKSMAQQTKSGHVYVISNIGSFGENVYKIGMTRRLEPLERVRELGNASVPFTFDVHAMIYSKDAPQLENILHKKFEEKRVNLVNNRKEFFNVSLEDIEREVKKEFPNSEFILTSEAREYRESQAIRNRKKVANDEKEELPEAI
ncbi:MAG: DUF4041 domain-containing protein [Pleomorphochaeta sp.]